MRRLDLTIGQRFGLGFGVLLVLLAVELGFSAAWLGRIGSLQAQQRDVVAPRAAAAATLEASVLYRAVQVRNYAATRDPEFLRGADAAWADGRAALRQIDRVSRDEDAAPAAEIASIARAYEDAADRFISLVGAGARGEPMAAAEREMVAVRMRFLRTVRDYAARQRARTEAAGAAILDAEAKTRAWLGWLAALVLATFAATALVVSRAVRNPARQLVRVARALAAGDFGAAAALDPDASAGQVPPRDEMRELGGSFGRMARALQRREARLGADARLSAALASSLDVARLADAALGEIVAHARAELGGLWMLDPGAPILHRVAGVALGSAAETLALGEGIPGEAAAAGRLIHVRDIPPTTPLRIGLGFDAAPPRAVVAAPIAFQGKTLGVALVASLRELGEDEVAFIEQSARRLGVALQNALGHREVSRLASALQQSNETLQAQNEELQAQHEEIQAQNEQLQAQQEEIQAQNEQLQAQAEELHAQSDQLQETADALVQADRRKDEFLAGLSHELRNPLAAIVAAAHLLEKRGAGDAAGARQAAIVSRQAGHLTRLVDDLLDVSRITHGKLRLRRAPVDVRRVLEVACEGVRPFIDARRHALTVDGGEGALLVNGDLDRLQQVIANLVHNAAKFTPPGGRITASAAREGDEVVVRVRDTGIGMCPELLARAFDPFHQGGGESLEEGLGVGLTLVRGLVEMHGGRVMAASDGPGRGSELAVRLPALSDAVEPAPAPDAAAVRRDGRVLQILIVDDNPDIASTMAEVVSEWGHAVTVHGTARAGLEAALASPPDVVLLDIGLPDMDGHEVARQLRRRLGDRTTTRLVALTGFGQPEDHRRSRDAGFDLHLVKPVAVEELRATLTKLASGAREI